MNKKAKIAFVSIVSNSSLICLKLIVGFLSGSVSIISEAIHSSMDLIAAIMAYIAVRLSSKKPDKKHPYGHGKFENVSGVVEGILIIVAAVWIIFEAIHKINNPGKISSYYLAIGVMFFSAVVNYFVSRKLYKVAKETNSIALEADALHLKADVYTSLGVGFGILLIWISGINILDPIIAIAVAVFILQEAYKLIIKAFDPLLDSRVEQAEIDKFCEIIRLNLPENTAIHDLRVRQNGSVYILDFALQVPPNMIVKDAHSICDLLEKKIRLVYADADINIHIEPKKD